MLHPAADRRCKRRGHDGDDLRSTDKRPGLSRFPEHAWTRSPCRLCRLASAARVFHSLRPGNGDTIIDVDVNPSEFLKYLQATKTTADLDELRALAAAKMSMDASASG